MHVHTVYSGDGYLTLKDIAREAKAAGLDGVALTDHDTVDAQRKSSDIDGLLMIPAVEVSSLSGHILAYGVTENIAPNRSAAETIDVIHSMGGVAIGAHIMRKSTTTLPARDIGSLRLDGLETVNASTLSPFAKNKAMGFASDLNAFQTGGSDAHVHGLVGRAYTAVDAEVKTVDGVLNALKRGRVTPVGGPAYTLQRATKVGLMIKRKIGFRGHLPSDRGQALTGP
ncbi:MAG: CehA/McbA family metallohydrolase [Candidatus Bathyarchaeia archaeon]